MLLSLLIVSWLIFVTTTASALFFRERTRGGLLGIFLLRTHAESPQAKKVAAGFAKACRCALLAAFGCSFLLLTRGMRPYAGIYLLVLAFAHFSSTWMILRHYREKLRAVKEKNGWAERPAGVVTVDLGVSREKGKSAVSAAWVWLFFLLSFAPLLYLSLTPAARETFPVGFSLIGPLCQTGAVFLYYQMKNLHAPAVEGEPEKNRACARAEERINTASAVLVALFFLIFWILLHAFIVFDGGALPTVLLAFATVLCLIWAAQRQRRKIRAAEDRIFGGLPEDPAGGEVPEEVWKWGCYCNPQDPRLFVPKRIASMGWTVNIGRPGGRALLFTIFALIAVLVGVLLYGNVKDYAVTVRDSSLSVDAALYDTTVEKRQVASVSVVDSLPDGTRTNGYAGAEKSYGHFTLNGYGKCMLYLYRGVGRYVVLKLGGNDPAYLILNGKSPEETQNLYREIRRWLEE